MENFIFHNNDVSLIIKHRLKICESCGLYDKGIFNLHPTCSANKYMNPETGEVSKTQKPGFKRGCGCNITYKVNNIKNKCPLDKW